VHRSPGTHLTVSAEDDVIEWLTPIALFWTVAALYLGGFAITIEGGGGLRHVLGLLATFVLFMVVYGVVHTVLRGMVGPVFSVALGVLVSTLLLPVLSRVGFMLTGVKIRKVAGHY
jgi:hypothetical protein